MVVHGGALIAVCGAGLSGVVLAQGNSPVTEGSALVTALVIVAYLVRETIRTRGNSRLDERALRAVFTESLREAAPCTDHTRDIAVLQSEVRALQAKLERLCDRFPKE